MIFAAILAAGLSAGQEAQDSDITQTAADIGDLSIFARAMEDAGYVSSLNGGGVFGFLNDGYVVFAPTDQAFENLTQGSLDALMADKGRLRTVMGYHIIDRRKLGEEGISSIEGHNEPVDLMTVQGRTVRINSNDGLTVNGARVLQSRRYDNGILYVIDQVLNPSEGDEISHGEE